MITLCQSTPILVSLLWKAIVLRHELLFSAIREIETCLVKLNILWFLMSCLWFSTPNAAVEAAFWLTWQSPDKWWQCVGSNRLVDKTVQAVYCVFLQRLHATLSWCFQLNMLLFCEVFNFIFIFYFFAEVHTRLQLGWHPCKFGILSIFFITLVNNSG